jgi:hypothetical protein
MEIDERIQYAIKRTEVLRPPEQSLATFGSTNVYYYIVTELMESANVVLTCPQQRYHCLLSGTD